MILHDYFRSSASYRVRIALNLKGCDYTQQPVDLRRGEQRSAVNLAVNPQGLVPTLEIDGLRLTQSLAIIDYLDLRFPEPPLMPADAAGRARVLAIALTIACDIHPIDNLRVLAYLSDRLGADQGARDRWYRHWVTEGLAALETMLADNPATGRFAHGDTPSLADICLVPQLFNARRFDVDLSPFPTLIRIGAAAEALPAFASAHPDRAGARACGQ